MQNRKSREQNAITLLTKDHQKVRKLLSQLNNAKTTSSNKKSLLQEIELELKVHTQIEEEIFYPAFKKAAKIKKDLTLFFSKPTRSISSLTSCLPSLKKPQPQPINLQLRLRF